MQHLLRSVSRLLSRPLAWLALVPFEKATGQIAVATAFAIVPLLLVAMIYGPPYSQTSEPNSASAAPRKCKRYSAVPGDYLRVPQENMLQRPHGCR